MARIPGVDPKTVEPRFQKVFEAQTRQWGAPLLPHLVQVRRPFLYRAIRGMWSAMGECEHIEAALQCLVNRRVAFHNGCVF